MDRVLLFLPLPPWHFAGNAAQRRRGTCNYEQKFIGLSASYALAIADRACCFLPAYVLGF